MSRLDPHFVSVAEAAEFLAVSRWQVYALLDSQKIASQYQGRKRLVVVESLRKYAEALPTTAPEPAA